MNSISSKVVFKDAFGEFKNTYEKDKILLDLEKRQNRKELDNNFKQIDEQFKNLSADIQQTNQIIKYVCVQRTSIDCQEIKSIINLGDITITSKKKFSRFSKWLWKKLFGWGIQDYQK